MDFANYKLNAGPYASISTLLKSIPIVKIPNYAFNNLGELKFKEKAEDWGLKIPSFSNGAILSDLDLDGDLDYVVNNINDNAFVFENTLLSKEQKPNYIQLELKGTQKNPNALGAKVVLRMNDGQIQFQEQQLTRGYMSSVDPVLYFGLGNSKKVDAIEVLWPNGLFSEIQNPELNQKLSLNQRDAVPAEQITFPLKERETAYTYQEVASKYNIQYVHQERNVQDFFNQRLIPHKLSQNGPSLAVGDMNGDGIEDFIIASSTDFSPMLYFQTKQDKFKEKALFTSEKDRAYEIESIALFDADQDDDLDLYLVSGGNVESSGKALNEDRLLLNDGKGNFNPVAGALPLLYSNGSVVRPFDYDNDGDLDLFVGGRNKPNAFPLADSSFLLENNQGKFKTVSLDFFPQLKNIGMVNDAQWGDLNQDGRADLVIVGEYTGIQVFYNLPEGFVADSSSLKETTGLWRTITILDVDQDGDQDLLVGNLGKNNMFSITEDAPLIISTQDIDQNGSVDPMMFCNQLSAKGNWEMFPTQFWDNLVQQSPVYRKEFNTYAAFSEANLQYYLDKNIIDATSMLDAKYDASIWIENLGEGNFNLHELPDPLQWGPINDFLVVQSEKELRIYVVGNDFGGTPFEGNFDAFQGGIMTFDGEIKFKSPQESGFYAFGDARDLDKVRLNNGTQLILVSQNGQKLLVFEQN